MIPEELIGDLGTLKDRGYVYDVQEDGGRVYIVFKGFPLPLGMFNLERTDLMIFTTPHYPIAGFDMFWVDVRLTLKSGSVPKSADSIESYLGRQWRRFSYHPYNSKPWNPSDDNVATFMAYVEQRLRRGD